MHRQHFLVDLRIATVGVDDLAVDGEYPQHAALWSGKVEAGIAAKSRHDRDVLCAVEFIGHRRRVYARACLRSEEHTSELQSLMRISYAVFCLKKKNKKDTNTDTCTLDNTEHTTKRRSE